MYNEFKICNVVPLEASKTCCTKIHREKSLQILVFSWLIYLYTNWYDVALFAYGDIFKTLNMHSTTIQTVQISDKTIVIPSFILYYIGALLDKKYCFTLFLY